MGHGGNGAGHAPCVDDQQYRQLEQFGDVGGAPRGGGGGGAVKKAHHPLDQRSIGVLDGAGVAFPHPIFAHHPRIEIPRRPAADAAMVAGVDVVGTALEGLHDQAPLPEGGHQAEGHRGLADS